MLPTVYPSVHASQVDDGPHREFAGFLLTRRVEGRTVPVHRSRFRTVVWHTDRPHTSRRTSLRAGWWAELSEAFLDQRRRIAAVLSASLGPIKVLRPVKVGCVVAVPHDIVLATAHAKPGSQPGGQHPLQMLPLISFSRLSHRRCCALAWRSAASPSALDSSAE